VELTLSKTNLINYTDPTGNWKQKAGASNQWIAERGDTLWGLAVKLYNNGARWTEFGFKRDPKTLQIGEVIKVGGSNGGGGTTTTQVKPDLKPEPKPELPSDSPTSVKVFEYTIRPSEALKNKIVVLDPGHGGHDNGASTLRSMKWYYEKNFNLRVADGIRMFLEAAGAIVQMTRYDDTFVTLGGRAHLASDQHANIFLSIHHDSSNLLKSGWSVIYAHKHDMEQSRQLGHHIMFGFVKYTSLQSQRGVVSNIDEKYNYYVLNATKMPAVLVECGYMGGDFTYCNTNYTKIAYAIFWGISQYYNNVK